MKKFVFSLQSVLDYRHTQEKDKKAEMAAAQAVLRRLEGELAGIEQDILRAQQGQSRALAGKKSVMVRLREYEQYLRALRERQLQLHKNIEQQELEVERIRGELVEAMQNIKALDKLKEEQYKAYLVEVAKEDEKAISDVVNFTLCK